MKAVDRVGQRFGRLIIIAILPERIALTICDCGNQKKIRISSIISGETKSCGCYRRECTRKLKTTHNHSRTKIYRAWVRMMERCYRLDHTAYKYYGGRGIAVCDRWHRFENFFEDMGEIPEGMSLDRIDVNGDYSKENCRWANSTIQSFNKRNSRENVYRQKNGKYAAQISNQNNLEYLGLFPTKEEAIKAYRKRKDEILITHGRTA